jgi:formylglycine-generating enzyme required for sulfatase activity
MSANQFAGLSPVNSPVGHVAAHLSRFGSLCASTNAVLACTFRSPTSSNAKEPDFSGACGQLGEWAGVPGKIFISYRRDDVPGDARGVRNRVVRGGSWYGNPQYLRSAFRGRITTVYRGDGIGFRVGRTLTP